jgi:hypothetical protein
MAALLQKSGLSAPRACKQQQARTPSRVSSVVCRAQGSPDLVGPIMAIMVLSDRITCVERGYPADATQFAPLSLLPARRASDGLYCSPWPVCALSVHDWCAFGGGRRERGGPKNAILFGCCEDELAWWKAWLQTSS